MGWTNETNGTDGITIRVNLLSGFLILQIRRGFAWLEHAIP